MDSSLPQTVHEEQLAHSPTQERRVILIEDSCFLSKEVMELVFHRTDDGTWRLYTKEGHDLLKGTEWHDTTLSKPLSESSG